MKPSMSPVVSLRDVHKSFGAHKVLDGVCFDVDRGQVTAIIGRSGSGKSTALRCIDRLERIDSGEIIVCDHVVSDPDVDLKALRLDVGIVFQSYNLFPHLTIEQNIMLAPRSVKRAAKSRSAHPRARSAGQQVGLGDKTAFLSRAAVRRPAAACRDRPLARHAVPRSCCSTRSPRRSTRN